jgi:hypothetical protein
MDGVIRGAEPRDLAAIAALAEEKRAWYERFQPTFWRPAADARERHTRFLQQLVERAVSSRWSMSATAWWMAS